MTLSEVYHPEAKTEKEEKSIGYLDIMQKFDIETYPAEEVDTVIENFKQTIINKPILFKIFSGLKKEDQYRIARASGLSEEELTFINKYPALFHDINNYLQFSESSKNFGEVEKN